MTVITPNSIGGSNGADEQRSYSTAEAIRRLRHMVSESAGRWKRWMILEAVSLAVGVPLAYLWLVFALDNWLHLSVWSRLLANVIFIGVAVWLVVSLFRRWRKLRFTEDQVALAMERQTGGVQNRLINAIQISRDDRHEHNEFGQAVIEENYQTLQRVALHQAGQVRPAALRVAFAGAMILVGLLFWILRPQQFTNAAARIMMPLANVDPIYQTVLDVKPGDVEASGDVTIRVRIKGKVPGELTVLRVVDGQRGAENVAVPKDKNEVQYTFKSVDRTMTYAVRGNDYTSPYYRITVPTPSSLAMVKVTYQFPEYTALGEKSAQSAGGDLEALVGTKAKLVFVFDHAADDAAMLLHRPGAKEGATERVALAKLSPTEFAGEVTFADVLGYQLETKQPNRPANVSGRYALHVRADQDPNVELSGLNKQAEVSPDVVLPLAVSATDDFGLVKVGLFARKLPDSATAVGPTTKPADEGWKAVEAWPGAGATQFRKDVQFSVATLGAVEGERYELAARAADADPAKNGALVTGNTATLVIGGEGAALQLLYEQIIRTENDLKALIASQDGAMKDVSGWMQKLDPASGLRWDDQANLDQLAAGAKALSASQDKVRTTAGEIARQMVAPAGNLKLSVGLLADTEMVRAIRIVEGVPTQDNVQSKRGALADTKLTQERTIRSLREILEQYVRFRQDWELGNMIPFTKMLADRQATLHKESLKLAEASGGGSPDPVRQNAASRRQAKVAELCESARVAFNGMAERVKTDEPVMSAAFGVASTALSAADLKAAMTEASTLLTSGQWAPAAAKQEVAAKALATIYGQLEAAKLKAAKDALAALQEQAKSDLEAQKALERLRAGSGENSLEGIDEAQLKMAEIIAMRDVAQKKAEKGEDPEDDMYRFDEKNSAALQQADSGKRQKFEHLKLPTSPHGLPKSFPNQSDRKGNNVKPHIQQEFQDLVGDLLDEAEELRKKYDTYNINLGVNIDEAGDVGKQGGEMNSTAAASATGNQKPPQHDQGGISRQGRMGARAHGMVMGDQGVNRRGRDEAQDAQERVPDQAGKIKQLPSDDMQKDISTGVGGKQVDTEEPTNWNTDDKGTFTEDIAQRMQKVAEKNVIVERQDGKMDPRVADMLRDLESEQEQVIERLKVIKKELKGLFLPTDQVDEAIKNLTANLERLKERPSGDIFRLQAETLDKLRGSLNVFTEYGAGYQPSLPRDQAVRGRVLDEQARQPIPGYEEAVKNYYEALAKP